MTVKQYKRKIEVARKSGTAKLDDTCVLVNHGTHWSIVSKDGNTIDTSYNPMAFTYICD